MKLFEGNNCSENVFIMNINEFEDKAVTTQPPRSQLAGVFRNILAGPGLQIGMNPRKNCLYFPSEIIHQSRE